jgi:hypothetical protein
LPHSFHVQQLPSRHGPSSCQLACSENVMHCNSSLLPTAIVTAPGTIPMIVTVPRAIPIIVVAGAMPMVNCRRSLVDICRTHRVRSPRRDCYARGNGKCNNPRFHILMYYPPWSLKLPSACPISYLSCLDKDGGPDATVCCWPQPPKAALRLMRAAVTADGSHNYQARDNDGITGDAKALGCSVKAVRLLLEIKGPEGTKRLIRAELLID